MKKILRIIVLSFFICNTYSYAGNINGSGELKMSNASVNNFIEYISVNKKPVNGKRPKPDSFIISQDGIWSMFWYCPYNRCLQNDKPTIVKCERETGVTCGRFAKRRTIYWDNGINTKKTRSKNAKFSSKMSESEIRAKLTELGFIGDTSTTTTTTPKITKKKEVNNEDIIKSLKSLKNLLDSGVLTEDEFKKAKKKLLN